MWSKLAAVAATQSGLFTRAQAVDAGFRGPAIRQLLGPGGGWVVVRRGVYMEGELWAALDEYRAKPQSTDGPGRWLGDSAPVGVSG